MSAIWLVVGLLTLAFVAFCLTYGRRGEPVGTLILAEPPGDYHLTLSVRENEATANMMWRKNGVIEESEAVAPTVATAVFLLNEQIQRRIAEPF